MSLARFHTFFLPALIASLIILAATFRLEVTLGLAPCSLCYSQRLMLGLYGLVCLSAVIHAPGHTGWRGYTWLALACAAGGATQAARHVWLQGASLQVDACAQPVAGLFEYSWSHTFKVLVLGGPDCGSLAWSFLDLTLPEWSLLAFLLLAALPLSRLLAHRLRSLHKG